MLKIRCYDPTDAIGLLDMFRHTIRAINSADYAPTQIDAWASDEIDVNEWRERFADRFAHVAMLDGRIVGFTDMTTTGHLDRLFVSAKHQRQGIARALLASNSSIFRGVLHGAPSRGSFNFFWPYGCHFAGPQTIRINMRTSSSMFAVSSIVAATSSRNSSP